MIKQDQSLGGNTPKIEINGSGDKIDGEEDNRNEKPEEEVKSSDVMYPLKGKKKKKRTEVYKAHFLS